MAVPQVTFPLEQKDIKPTFEKLTKHLKGLQADTRIVQEMLRTIRTFCSHPSKTKYSCPDCGQSWDYD
jgi:hypothetical protein